MDRQTFMLWDYCKKYYNGEWIITWGKLSIPNELEGYIGFDSFGTSWMEQGIGPWATREKDYKK